MERQRAWRLEGHACIGGHRNAQQQRVRERGDERASHARANHASESRAGGMAVS
jgi:hypothetical protein